MIVYHGSIIKIENIDLTNCRPHRDFGRGFYVTKFQKHAENMAKIMGHKHKKEGVITEFEYSENAFTQSICKIKHFENYDEEWLDRACTVLYELMEVVKFGKSDKVFFNYVPTSTIQRLGYLLENELEQIEQANILYSKSQTYSCKFQKIPLKNNKPTNDCETDEKWKIIVNEKIEIDEI
jgi:hypothetical protein